MKNASRRVTVTKLMIVMVVVIALVQASHLYLLGKTRVHARATLAHTLQDATTSDTERSMATLEAFDRMTGDIFLAASGPYLILAVLIPCLIVNLVRLQNNLTATERALMRVLKNGEARGPGMAAPFAAAKVNHPQNGS